MKQEFKPPPESKPQPNVHMTKLPPLIADATSHSDDDEPVSPKASLPPRPVVEDKNHKNEAYVTMATCDLHAVGCLVLGHSVRITGTNRNLAVIISGGVSASIR